MKKYEPKYVYDEVAIQGWESAALFVQGVKMAGNNLTQANVIKQDNSITSFTAGGLTAPINWKDAGHSGHAPPYCSAYIKVSGDKYVPTLNTGEERVRLLRVDQPEQGSGVPRRRPARPLPPDRRKAADQGRITAGSGHQNGAVPRVRAPRRPVRVHLCAGRRLPGPDLPGHRRLQLRLRRAGLRVRLRLHVPDRVPELVGVRGLPGLGRGDGARRSGWAFDRLLFRHIANSNTIAKMVCSLALLVGIPTLLPVIFGPQNLDATATILPFFNPNVVYFTLLGHADQRDLPVDDLGHRGRARPAHDPAALHEPRDCRCAPQSRAVDWCSSTGSTRTAWSRWPGSCRASWPSLAGVLLAPVFGAFTSENYVTLTVTAIAAAAWALLRSLPIAAAVARPHRRGDHGAAGLHPAEQLLLRGGHARRSRSS